jgi:hypothetical protein
MPYFGFMIFMQNVYIQLCKLHISYLQCISTVILSSYAKGKGKAIPLQALTGPEVSRMLRLPDFKAIGT